MPAVVTPLPSQSVELWVPPMPATGNVESNNTIGTTGQQYPPMTVPGFNAQTIQESGSAGLAQTDE